MTNTASHHMIQIRDVEGGDKLLQRRPFICTRGAADVVLVLLLASDNTYRHYTYIAENIKCRLKSFRNR